LVGTHLRSRQDAVAKFVDARRVPLALAAIFVFSIRFKGDFLQRVCRTGKILLNIVLIIFVNDTSCTLTRPRKGSRGRRNLFPVNIER
jgi:hypothetical protein